MIEQKDPSYILQCIISKLPCGLWFSLHQQNTQFTQVSNMIGLSPEEWDALLLASGVYKIRGTQKRLFMDKFREIMNTKGVHDTRKKIDAKDVFLICYT